MPFTLLPQCVPWQIENDRFNENAMKNRVRFLLVVQLGVKSSLQTEIFAMELYINFSNPHYLFKAFKSSDRRHNPLEINVLAKRIMQQPTTAVKTYQQWRF